jgi:hypothetical protein
MEMDKPTKYRTPLLTLLFLAPLIAEILPGATRFSAIFVFPIELFFWGGGAVLIREVVRRQHLTWRAMLLLSVALALAEELVVQQTSLAPLVIQIRGVEYGRAFGVNYVYLLWALIYEPVLVVLLPVALTEMIFPEHAALPWLRTKGTIIMIFLMIVGGLLAWYSWTHIARVTVFHVGMYTPSPEAFAASILVIAGIVILAVRSRKNTGLPSTAMLAPPSPWIVGALGGLWAVLLHALVVLAFGLAPEFPTWIPVTTSLVLMATPLLFLPRWMASTNWSFAHQYGLAAGSVIGAMLVGFVGFIGALPADLNFKIATNAVALVLLVWWGWGKRIRTS